MREQAMVGGADPAGGWVCLFEPAGRGLMARKGKANSKFHARYVDAGFSLGTLGGVTSIVADLTANADRDLYLISADVVVALDGLTAGEGPLEVGLCHGTYTQTEIDGYIETTTDIDVGNPIANEAADRGRYIKTIGMFQGLNTDEVLFDGRPRRIKLKFPLQEGEALAVWVYNRTGATLTTGCSVRISGKLYFVEK